MMSEPFLVNISSSVNDFSSSGGDTTTLDFSNGDSFQQFLKDTTGHGFTMVSNDIPTITKVGVWIQNNMLLSGVIAFATVMLFSKSGRR